MIVHASSLHLEVDCPQQSRTKAQYEAFTKIVTSPEFDFMCLAENPFSDEVGDYTGKFAFTYYEKNGDMVCKLIDSDGSVSEIARMTPR